MNLQHIAHQSLADLTIIHDMRNRFSPSDRRHCIFKLLSRNIAVPNTCSAINFLVSSSNQRYINTALQNDLEQMPEHTFLSEPATAVFEKVAWPRTGLATSNLQN